MKHMIKGNEGTLFGGKPAAKKEERVQIKEKSEPKIGTIGKVVD